MRYIKDYTNSEIEEINKMFDSVWQWNRQLKEIEKSQNDCRKVLEELNAQKEKLVNKAVKKISNRKPIPLVITKSRSVAPKLKEYKHCNYVICGQIDKKLDKVAQCINTYSAYYHRDFILGEAYWAKDNDRAQELYDINDLFVRHANNPNSKIKQRLLKISDSIVDEPAWNSYCRIDNSMVLVVNKQQQSPISSFKFILNEFKYTINIRDKFFK